MYKTEFRPINEPFSMHLLYNEWKGLFICVRILKITTITKSQFPFTSENKIAIINYEGKKKWAKSCKLLSSEIASLWRTIYVVFSTLHVRPFRLYSLIVSFSRERFSRSIFTSPFSCIKLNQKLPIYGASSATAQP